MSFKITDIANNSDDVALEKVKVFIESNPTKLNQIYEWFSFGKGTLLHFSCIFKKPKVVSYLLSKNADVTKCFISKENSWNGLTAQKIAEKNGYVDIVNLFEQSKREQAAREQAAREQAAREQAAREQAEREQAARKQAKREQEAREAAKREQVTREQAEREQAAREKLYQFLNELEFDESVIQKIERYGVRSIKDFVHFGKDDWDNLALPPFQKNKIINQISQPVVNILTVEEKPIPALQPSPSPQQKTSPALQPSPTPQPVLNLRCFENVESNARVPLAPFILLNSSESPVPFEHAILCAYEGVSISDHLDSFMAHGEGEIFEDLVQKGTTITLPECLAVYFYTLEWPQKDLNTYSRLNKCLVSENREGARRWRFFLHYLFGALRKITKWDGRQDLYRGVDCNLVEDYPDKYIIGRKITWYSCTSTTTNLSKIMSFLPPNKPRTIFTINGVISGRPIQNFSAVPDEAEILIPPGSRFEIVSVAQLDPNTTMIQIKQIASLEKQLKLE